VSVDEAALKAKLRQVKISGSKNVQTTFFLITLTLPKASDPAMKFVEIAQDPVTELCDPSLYVQEPPQEKSYL
jgi:hypothetical protein